MLNLTSPQRFYQVDFSPYEGETVTEVIDLKRVLRIALSTRENYKGIIVFLDYPGPPLDIKLKETDVGAEDFYKLVTAWTTYKMSTEK